MPSSMGYHDSIPLGFIRRIRIAPELIWNNELAKIDLGFLIPTESSPYYFSASI